MWTEVVHRSKLNLIVTALTSSGVVAHGRCCLPPRLWLSLDTDAPIKGSGAYLELWVNCSFGRPLVTYSALLASKSTVHENRTWLCRLEDKGRRQPTGDDVLRRGGGLHD